MITEINSYTIVTNEFRMKGEYYKQNDFLTTNKH